MQTPERAKWLFCTWNSSHSSSRTSSVIHKWSLFIFPFFALLYTLLKFFGCYLPRSISNFAVQPNFKPWKYISSTLFICCEELFDGSSVLIDIIIVSAGNAKSAGVFYYLSRLDVLRKSESKPHRFFCQLLM